MCVQASIQEVLGSSDGESALQMMTKDQYANYVVQKMLEVSTCWHAVLCCAVLCCAVIHLSLQHAVFTYCASMPLLCCGAPG